MSGKPYTPPAIQIPTVAKLRPLAAKLGFDLTDQQLQDYADLMVGYVDPYTKIDNLPEPTLPVKYPRTPGYRPGPEENTHNAWYWKTDIKGAPSGILAGKTVAFKDNIAVAGVPMMNGSRVLEGYMPEFDATVVTRVLDAGGHVMGKTACDDMCLASTCLTPATGTVNNPVNKDYDAGGSSGGSATVVALGEVDMALGGDQGGSVRIPASRCGIVGLKPTYGLIPYSGTLAIEPSVDYLGPMAKTVKETALLLEAIAGPDGYDQRQGTMPPIPEYSKKITGDIKGLKVGILKEAFPHCDEDVSDIVRAAIAKFDGLGVTVEEVSIPQFDDARDVWTAQIFDGAWNTMVRGHGSGVGFHGFYPTSMSEHLRRGYKTVANDLSKTNKLIMLFGNYIEENYGLKFYQKSMNMQPMFKKAFDDVMKNYAVLAMPTLPTRPKQLPTEAGVKNEKDFVAFALGHILEIVAPFNYTGHPAISLNAGFSEGLPVGIQLVANTFDESTLFNVAFALEQELKK